MAVARFLLLLLVVVAHHYAITAPNARPPTEQLRDQSGLERIIPYLTAFARTMIWTWAVLEGSHLLALSGHCPPALANLLHALLPTTFTAPTVPTPAFLAGTLLRTHCFHALGPRFTFELSIRPAHVLVTDGVYGVVRHPSYTGAGMVAVGWLLCVGERRGWIVGVCGGYVRAVMAGCGFVSGGGAWGGGGGGGGDAVDTAVWACMWTTALVTLCVTVKKRMDREDAMLERAFGEVWRAWAKRVPYRLVPSVY